MAKFLMALTMVFIVSGCTATNPPPPPEAQGKWEPLHTTINDIQRGF